MIRYKLAKYLINKNHPLNDNNIQVALHIQHKGRILNILAGAVRN